jgi:hypothetical protein
MATNWPQWNMNNAFPGGKSASRAIGFVFFERPDHDTQKAGGNENLLAEPSTVENRCPVSRYVHAFPFVRQDNRPTNANQTV